MNIAILVSGLPPQQVGGAEVQAARAAQYLAAAHQVTVLTRTGPVPAELESLPACTVVRRSRVTLRGLRFAADIIATLARIGRARKEVDVILAYQTVIDGLIAVLAGRLFRIPVLVSIRCDSEFRFDRHRQARLLAPFVFRRADRLAVQSPSLAQALIAAAGPVVGRDRLERKLCVIPNGISAAETGPADGDNILYVGRLVRQKAVHVLLEAMRQCPQQRLVVVGDGPERRALEAQARDQPNVVFTGAVSHRDVQQQLRRAKVLVLPSIEEGQPNVVMEAMRHGVPVIATRVGGVPDLVADGVTGFLVDPGDSDAIGRRIRMLCADAALRQQMAVHAREVIRGYTWEVAIGVLERELAEVARRTPGAAASAAAS